MDGINLRLSKALRASRARVALRHFLRRRRPRKTRNPGRVEKPERDCGQNGVFCEIPAHRVEAFQFDGKKQNRHRGNQHRWQANSDKRNRADCFAERPVFESRRRYSRREPENQGEREGVDPERKRDLRLFANQLVDAPSVVFVRRPQLAASQIFQEIEVLRMQRLVEPVVGVQRLLRFRGHGFFAVEGPAGDEARHEKHGGYYQK